MNTINKPLKITKYNDDRVGHYWVRDMGSTRDYSGEYVSKELAVEMLDALEHCLAIFKSQSDRGYYPKELLSDEPEFLGKQGFRFLSSTILKAKGQ